MCCTIVFNWTPVFTLFDRWCYFQCSEVSSCMITVADKSLERPIKVTLYFHRSTLLVLLALRYVLGSGEGWGGGHNCVTVSVGMF